MPSLLFVTTVVCLCIYTIDQYNNKSVVAFIHGCYTVLLIVYNSTVKQSHPKFKWLNNRDTMKNRGDFKQEKIIQCKICRKPKPPRYYHCRRCNMCIFRMDHHCDWLGCCVGQFNFKVYMHILVNLLIIGLYCLYETTFNSQSWLSTRSVIIFVFAAFILWEAGRMIIGCVDSIENNQTLVETYKRVKGPRKPIYKKLQQFMGSPNIISWLVPLYSKSQNCNIWERTYPVSQQAAKNIEEHTYADEYIYGPDDNDDELLHHENKTTKSQ